MSHYTKNMYLAGLTLNNVGGKMEKFGPDWKLFCETVHIDLDSFEKFYQYLRLGRL